ncbi:MAG: GNAT family N-acetyltransferase [Actinomycetota bacterium]
MATTPEPNEVITRFLQGFAAQVDVDPAVLGVAGVSLAPRPDRADSGVVAVYRVDDRIVLWCDPAVASELAPLVDDVGPAPLDEWQKALDAAAFDLAGAARMRVAPELRAIEPNAAIPYLDGHLLADAPDTLPLVEALTGQCDPDEVEAAALDELDDYDEVAINVVTAGDDPSLVAYASAELWEWDDVFGDIGVLVHPDHRRQGLGLRVVSRTTLELLEEGRLPLYRHEVGNAGSSGLADQLGFRPVADLAVFVKAGG